MKYYLVRKDFAAYGTADEPGDGVRVYKFIRQYTAGELITPAEWRRATLKTPYLALEALDGAGKDILPEDALKPVYVSKKRVHWFFGARLANEGAGLC